MPIDQEREEQILQLAEDRATDDADSLYPLAEEDEAVLVRKGQWIAHEFDLSGEEATLFAEHYASLYQAEIDCLDQDYEPEDEAERGSIAARRIRLADLDPLSTFYLQTSTTEGFFTSYRRARQAYNYSRRTHKSARLSLVRYLDTAHERLLDKRCLLACGLFKQ
jgi:hypothetical protein